MNTNDNKVDLKTSCTFYSTSIQRTLQDLFNIQVETPNEFQSVRQLDSDENLYMSILFTGQIYGEFLIGLNKRTALQMLEIDTTSGEIDRIYEQHRDEIVDTYKEVLNIAAGTTIGQLKSIYPNLSITPPRAIEGKITLSSFDINRLHLSHPSGGLSCYIYVDYMKLDIADAMEREERLNRAKSEFLANMSHELRTPLNGMIGMLDILKTSPLTAGQKEQFDVIYRSGEFLLSLISDILEFSKIESGKMEIEKNPFDLRKAIETVTDSLATVVFKRGLDFNIFVDPEIQYEFVGDETRLKQVLINLIGNAVKFTPSGSITVTAQMENENVLIHVTDTGIGIPKDKLEQIFQSFSQVDVSDVRKYGGTGLGLSISKSIIDAMGGKIQVESEEAKGSTFTLIIPLEHKPAVAVETPFTGKTIHIQSDNPSLVQSLNHYAAALGARLVSSTPEARGGMIWMDARTWRKKEIEDARAIAEFVQQSGSTLVFMALPHEMDKTASFNQTLGSFDYQLISLPITLAKIEALKDPPKSIAICSAKPQAGTDRVRKVLVVEDNDVNQYVISTMLKKLNYEIHTASNGQQAVEIVQKGEQFDLILMDCQMPILSGFDATKAIREFEKQTGQHTPIIALTANAFRETKEECFSAGMDDFATKPLKFETLKDLIRRTNERLTN